MLLSSSGVEEIEELKTVGYFDTFVKTRLRGLISQKKTNIKNLNFVGYSESKYRLRISVAHPRDCHFAFAL